MELINMIGHTFGELRVICRAPNNKGHTCWKCICSCGNEVIVNASNLRSGHTKSCGHCERFIKIDDETVMCRLKAGGTFLIDAKDLSTVSLHKWSVENSGYIQTTINGKHVRLHRYLLNEPDLYVDHINGDRTDNRRKNLRCCSNKENCRNQGLSSRNTSGFKGVSFDRRRGRYSASITVDGNSHFLGYDA